MKDLRKHAAGSLAWFRRGGPWSVALVLTAFVLIYFSLQRTSSAGRSATNDEPLHLAAGYAALKYGDFRFDPTHPPFLRMMAASALLGRMTHPLDMSGIDTVGFDEWTGRSFQVSSDFIYGESEANALLEAARFRTMLMGGLLGLLIFAWVRECMGLIPAALTLGLYTIEPNLAGHATLVTTDVGVTCFMFGSVYFFWRTQRRYTAGNLAGLALFTALAVISKYSAVLLAPILGLLLVVAVRRGTVITVRRALGLLGVVGATCIFAIWAIYGFRYAPGPAPQALLRTDGLQVVTQYAPVLAAMGNWIDGWHLLPNAFTQGFLLNQASAEALPSYLNGAIRDGGWWYYFPVAFALKTPAALLILSATGLVGLIWTGDPIRALERRFILLPIAVYLAFAMASDINLGVRHILPIYPFVLFIAATAIHELARARQIAGRLALCSVAALAVYRYHLVWPHNLTFFNALAGGPLKGGEYLTDSNLDWGQHLKALKQWMNNQGVERINFAYSGTTNPTYFGIEGTFLPGSPVGTTVGTPQLPGYVAISKTIQAGVYLTPDVRLFYRQFQNVTPAAVVGNSIDVYWVEDWPILTPDPQASDETLAPYVQLADAFLIGVQDYHFAILYYEAYLTARPTDSIVVAKLGYAYLKEGAISKAGRLLHQAVDLAENPARFGAEIAVTLAQSGYLDEGMLFARQAMEYAPGDPLVHDAMGITLVFLGREEEALTAFGRALELAPSEPEIQGHMAEIKRRLASNATDMR